jgi:NAD+ synthase
MITNVEGLTNYLVTWMQGEAKKSGTRNGCVGLSGGIDSAVVFALCCRAFPETVGVLMPCHSSRESIDRAREVLRSQAQLGYCCRGITVQLEAAFDSIVAEVETHEATDTKFCQGSLRSCLRAPVLDYVSKCNDALIYGTGNRDEDEIFRYFQKRGDGCVDNNPIVGLHKSEVRQLAAYLGLPQSVIDAVPTADLWGPDGNQTDEGELGITYDEIEWVTRMNDTHQILEIRADFEPTADGFTVQWEEDESGPVEGTLDPGGLGGPVRALSPMDGFRKRYADKFTPRQFEVIEKAFHMERASRHKASPPPGPRRSAINFYVI